MVVSDGVGFGFLIVVVEWEVVLLVSGIIGLIGGEGEEEGGRGGRGGGGGGGSSIGMKKWVIEEDFNKYREIII